MIIFLNCIHKNISSFWLSTILFKIEKLTKNKVTCTTHKKINKNHEEIEII